MKSIAVVLAISLGVVVSGCATSESREPEVARGCPFRSVLASKRSVRRVEGGAEVIIPVAVGMSAEYVEHGVRCELGRDDVNVHVLNAGDMYAVRITSDDPAVAREIFARFER